MSVVTVKDKFQVTIPAKLRERVPLRVGDLLEATVHGDGILLRPRKAVVDRDAVADELTALLRGAPTAPEDEGKPESVILEEAIADVAAARARDRRRRKG